MAIPLPGTPILIVLQNLFIMLSALILGPVWGTVSVIVYLLLGMAGLPVFSGGTGGLARFWGPSGGFLLGYVPAALAMGLISRWGKLTWWKAALAIVAGSCILYGIGLPVLKAVLKISWTKAFLAGMLPFLPGDFLKAVVAVPVALALKPWLEDMLDSGKGRG
jgi:biotin transport system substrate-specific component